MDDYRNYLVRFKHHDNKITPSIIQEITITATDALSAMRIASQMYGKFNENDNTWDLKSLEIIDVAEIRSER